MTKVCSVCQLIKPLEAFNKQRTGKQGRRADCKECVQRFVKSKSGLINQIYSGQIARTKRKGFSPISYTKQELTAWLLQQYRFNVLYQNWVASGYSTALKPSVDRLDDDKGYALNNIQLLTWTENNQKGYEDTKNGKNIKQCKAIDMLDMNGQFIKQFHSVSEAARQFNGIPSNIVGAINHRRSKHKKPDGSYREYICTKAYGYKWRYSNK